MFTSVDLSLSAAERVDLEHLVRATSTPAGIARRARCVLLLADGATYAAVCTALAVTDRFIARWKQRYIQGGILALADAPRSGRQSHRLRPAVEAQILRLTQYEPPPAPLTHWSSPRMAERVGVSPSTVQRVRIADCLQIQQCAALLARIPDEPSLTALEKLLESAYRTSVAVVVAEGWHLGDFVALH